MSSEMMALQLVFVTATFFSRISTSADARWTSDSQNVRLQCTGLLVQGSYPLALGTAAAN